MWCPTLTMSQWKYVCAHASQKTRWNLFHFSMMGHNVTWSFWIGYTIGGTFHLLVGLSPPERPLKPLRQFSAGCCDEKYCYAGESVSANGKHSENVKRPRHRSPPHGPSDAKWTATQILINFRFRFPFCFAFLVAQKSAQKWRPNLCTPAPNSKMKRFPS